MLHATRIALIQILQARLADEQAMMKKLRDRYIELDIERFAAELEAMDWQSSLNQEDNAKKSFTPATHIQDTTPLNDRLTNALKDVMHSCNILCQRACLPPSGRTNQKYSGGLRGSLPEGCHCRLPISRFTAYRGDEYEVFWRYNSFDADDLKRAAMQQQQFITNLAQSTSSVPMHPSKQL